MIPHAALPDDGAQVDPVRVGEGGDRGRRQGRQQAQSAVDPVAAYVHRKRDARRGSDRPAEHHQQAIELGLFPAVVEGVAVSDGAGRALEHHVHHSALDGAQRRRVSSHR